MDEKGGIEVFPRDGSDLERSDCFEQLIAAVDSTRRPSHTRSNMIHGTGIQAFVGMAIHTSWYTLQDAVAGLRQRSKSESSSDLCASVFGWPPPKPQSLRETAWLDGLRGIAAFLVMALHFNLAWVGMTLEAPYGTPRVKSYEIWRLPFLRLLVCSGHAQVSIFFVLSGFVLSWGPLAAIRSRRYDYLNQVLASATFRRWIRLYLPCFVIGMWSILEFRWGILDVPVGYKKSFLWQCWDYIAKFEQFSNPIHLEREGWESIQVYAWVMWTIPLEFAGSMLVFILLLAVSRIHNYRKRTVVIAGIAMYTCILARWNYWLFASGMLIADYVRQMGGFEQMSNWVNSQFRYRIACYACLAVGLFLAGVPIPMYQLYPTTGYDFLNNWVPDKYRGIEGGARFWWSWAAIMIITSACHLGGVRRLLESSVAQYLGRISFMLYLTHVYVLECLSTSFQHTMYQTVGWVELQGPRETKVWTTGPVQAVVIFIILWTVLGSISLIVAHWCQILVDEPCVRLAKWVDAQFVDRGSAEAESTNKPALLPT